MRELVYSTLFNLLLTVVFAVPPKDATVKESDDASGCSYRGNFYNSGMKIKSQDPCVYCVCEGSTLQCTLELCSTYSTIPRGCKLVSKPGKCCQELVCDKTFSKVTPTKTQLKQGCTVAQTHYKDGEAIPSSDPCQQCYCLQNQTQCITQECLLPPDVVLNCQPAIEKDKCCPVRYHCQNGNEHQTIEVPSPIPSLTSTSKTPTVTTISSNSSNQSLGVSPGGRLLNNDKNNQKTHLNGFSNATGCEEDGHWYKIGDHVVRGNDPCMTCICDKDGVTCTIVQCRELPLGVSSCKQARENECCQQANNCTCTYNINEPYARSYEQTTCEFCSYNGTAYPLGARIHTSERCQVCLCRDTGIYCLGRAECDDPPEQLTKYKSCKPFYNDDLDACCPYGYDCLDSQNKIKRILQSGKEIPDSEAANISSSARDTLGDDSDVPLITAINTKTDSIDAGCDVEGKKYKLGDIIDMDDPCLHCKCNTDSAVTCSRSTCHKLPFGVKECAPKPGQCCPDWKNCTCNYQKAEYHTVAMKELRCTRCLANNIIYQPGEKLQVDDICYTCMCKDTGISCEKAAKCPNEMTPEEIKARQCDPVYDTDQCCPSHYKCNSAPRFQGRILHQPANAANNIRRRPRPRPKGCFHNGKAYQFNEELPKTDPCSTCTCDTNGTVACVTMQCQRQPIGVTGCKRIANSNICCPVLVDCSCFHLADAPEGRVYTDITCGTCLTQNHRYRPGDIIPSHDPCRQCECTERGVVCDTVMECDAPPGSQDCTPIFDGKQCCPVEYECRRPTNRDQNLPAPSPVQRPPNPYPTPTARPPSIVFPNPPRPSVNSRLTSNRDSPLSPISGRKTGDLNYDDYYYYDEGTTTSNDYAQSKRTPPPPKAQANFNMPAPSFKNDCYIGNTKFNHGDEIQMINSCNRCRCYNSTIKCSTLPDCRMGTK